MTLITSKTTEQPVFKEPASASSLAGLPNAAQGKKKRIAFFGWFGGGNFGNDVTLHAMLYHLCSLAPNTEFSCISNGSSTVAAAYEMTTIPSRTSAPKPRESTSSLTSLALKHVRDMRRELHQWLYSVRALRSTDALIVPGTGLLTDAYSLLYWGPYDMFRWSVAAKLWRCKLLFVSVGAGPIFGRRGRFFVKTALSLADFRSYRDEPTRQYLAGIGCRANKDPVYPDLAFSLPESLIPRQDVGEGHRPVVGLGLMVHAGRYGWESPTGTADRAYLETLVEFVDWVLAHEYDVRLLIGDLLDTRVTQEFKSLLRKRSVGYEEDRIIDEPIASAEDLLKQVAATDIVVATRFHNVLLALLLNKPVIAISFHHKCASLMTDMGLSEYCQDIDGLNLGWLTERFSQLDQSADDVKRTISERVGACRDMLDEQYATIFNQLRTHWVDRLAGGTWRRPRSRLRA